jgi:hypothetical protein
MYEDHKMAGMTGLTWDHIWSPSLDFLLKQPKGRGPEEKKKKNKKNYAEKTDYPIN